MKCLCSQRMGRNSTVWRCLALAGFFLAVVDSQAALAQPVPSKDGAGTHVFPAGGRRGTRVAVRIGTESLPPRTEIHLTGSHVTAPGWLETPAKGGVEPSPRRRPTEIPISYPREWESTFTIAEEAPAGVVYWRLSSAGGGTRSRPFVIGELPEFIETESNSQPELAEPVALPVTINGRIAGERDADYFRFRAVAGQVVSCELACRRLGSPLDPVVQVTGPGGARVAVREIHLGSDPAIEWTARVEGDYLLRIAHVGGAGGPHYVYRATVQHRPLPSPQAYLSPASHTVAEAAAHGAAGTAQAVPLPARVLGTFAESGEEDWYAFETSAAERVAIEVRIPPGSAAAPLLELRDGAGASVTRADPPAVAGRISRVEFAAPAAGIWRLVLRDRQQATGGGSDFAYVLELARQLPDYLLSLKSDVIGVTPGESATLEVVAERRGGFAGPIEVTADGLPPGVTLAPAVIAENQAGVTLTLSTAGDADCQAGIVRIGGKATIGDETVTRIAKAPHAGVDPEQVALGEPTLDHVFLAVRHKPLFRLFCNEAYQYAHRGTIYPYFMEVERLNGFDGEIVVQLADRQNRDLDGIDMLELRIPPGSNSGMMPIYLPESMHINVQSQSQLYTQACALFEDARGRPRALCAVSEKRNMIRTLPTVARLVAVESTLSASPGSQVDCRLLLQRTVNCPATMALELHGADARVTAPRVPLAEEQSEARLAIRVAEGARRGDLVPLTVRATGTLESGATVVTEARVTLHIE